MTKETFTIFDQYLAGELSGDEKTELEAQLQSSGELRHQYLEFKTCAEAMIELPRQQAAKTLAQKLRSESVAATERLFEKYSTGVYSEKDRLSFKEELEENEWLAYRFEKYHQKDQEKSIVNRRGAKIISLQIRRALAYAACLTLVVVAGWWVFMQQEKEVGQSDQFPILTELTVPIFEITYVGDTKKLNGTNENIQVKIIQNNMPEAVAVFEEKMLKVYLPVKNPPSKIGLFKLEKMGDGFVYLGLNKDWYKLDTGSLEEQPLVAEQDENILKLLN